MKKKVKIYYSELTGSKIYDSISCVSYDPISLFDYTEEKSVYYSCPAWGHKAKRTFLIKSPIDINLYLNTSYCDPGTFNLIPRLESSNLTQDGFNEIVSLHENWYSENKVTVQLNIPRYIFWTDEKNVWMDLRSSSITPSRCNIQYVGGWFNISSWNRPASFAFNMEDKSKQVSIKRGDVVNEVCFYTKDLNDYIILERKEIPEKIYEKMESRVTLKQFVKNLSSKIIFGESEELNNKGKCPFKTIMGK